MSSLSAPVARSSRDALSIIANRSARRSVGSREAIVAGLLAGVCLSAAQPAHAQVYCVNASGAVVNPAGTDGTGAVVCGAGSQAAGTNAVAIGQNANASSVGSTNIAIGPNAVARGVAAGLGDQLAIGTSARATGQDSTAIGGQTTASGNNTLAIGNNGTTASGDGSTAFGSGANATGANSLATGNNARATAANASALGANANASTANSVALGANSTTAAVNTGSLAIAGGTAAGTSPTGVVSVGASGAAGFVRQIQNVGAGVLSATSTDAVNGSQLFATNQVVTTHTTQIGNIGSSLVSGLGGGTSYNPSTGILTASFNVGGTTYSSVYAALTAINTTASAGFNVQANGGATQNIAPGGAINFVNGGNIVVTRTGNQLSFATVANPTFSGLVTANGGLTIGAGQTVNMGGNRVTNVAAGTLGAASTDAVNGSQLFATNQNVAANAANITNLGTRVTTAEGNITTLDGRVTTAEGAIATNTGDIDSLDTRVTTNEGDITALQQDALQWNPALNAFDASHASGAPQAITNVAAGALDAASTDAVNGAQLFATNQNVAANASDIANLGGDVANGTIGTVQRTGTAGQLALVAPGGSGAAPGAAQRLSNVAAGTGATDAVNLAQLQAAQSHYLSVNDLGAPQGNFSNDGATGGFAIAMGPGASATSNFGTAIGYQASTSGNETIVIGAQTSSPGRSSIYIGTQSGNGGAATNNVNIGIGTRAGQNVLGEANTGLGWQSGNGVTGDRNTALGKQTGSNIAGSSNVGLGDFTGRDITGSGNVAIGLTAGNGVTASNTISIGSGALASGESAIAIGTGNQVSGANSGAFGDPNIVTGNGSYAFGNNNTIAANNALALGNGIAIAAGLDGAVGIGDATTVAAAVGTSGVTIRGTDYAFAGANPTSTVSVGAAGAERTITNVAAGRIDSASTDAINGSQLFATNSAIEALTTGVGNTDSTAVKYVWNDANGDGVVDPGEVDFNRVVLAGTGGTTIGNVAPGALNAGSTDAVNGSQLFATNQQVAANTGDIANLGTRVTTAEGNIATNASDITDLGTRVTTNEGDIAALDTRVTTNEGDIATNTSDIAGLRQDALQWNPALAAYDASHGGGAPQAITNVAAGALNAGSTDAVNGSQLFATNQALAALDGVANAGINIQADGGATQNIAPGGAIDFVSGGNIQVTRNGNRLSFATVDNPTFAGMVTANGGLTVGAGQSVDMGGNRVTNVATGTAATDAVNLAQLQGATQSGANADGTAVKYVWNDANGNGIVDPGEVDTSRVVLAGAGGTTISNVAPGALSAASTDAVNGSQLFATNQNVAQNLAIANAQGSGFAAALGGGAAYDPASGTVTPPTYVIANTDGSTTSTNNVGGAISALNGLVNQPITYAGNSGSATVALGGTVTIAGAATTPGTYSGANLATRVDPATGSVNVEMADSPQFGSVTVNANGSGRISGVAAGTAATDAVNVAQLNAATQGAANTAATAVQYVWTDSNGNGAVDPGEVDNGRVVLAGANGTTISNVAAGAVSATSSEAVNGAQLFATNQQVAQTAAATSNLGASTAAALGGASTYDPATGQVTAALNVGGNSYGDVNSAINAVNATASAGWNVQANGGPATNIPSNGTLNVTGTANAVVVLNGNQLQVAVVDNPTFAGTVTANGGLAVGAGQQVDMGGNVVRNVAAGAVTATSTDAVNGSQLYAAQTMAANAVQYDDGDRTSVTFNPGGDAAVLHNVGAGVAPTDAVNVGQLNAGLTNTLALATAYTDRRIAGLQFDLSRYARQSNAGIAGALAAAALPQAFEPGASMLSFGGGTFQGQSAFAFGLSSVLRDGRTVLRAGANYNTRGQAGANVGVGIQF